MGPGLLRVAATHSLLLLSCPLLLFGVGCCWHGTAHSAAVSNWNLASEPCPFMTRYRLAPVTRPFGGLHDPSGPDLSEIGVGLANVIGAPV